MEKNPKKDKIGIKLWEIDKNLAITEEQRLRDAID